MRLTPREPEIPREGGFTDDNDIFGYRDFANRLANLVSNIDEPLVMALDGPWGSGKSIFVKQWAGLLRARGAPVIEFDSFASDYYEDAFFALSAEIYAAARTTLGGKESTTRRYFNKAKKAGAVLAPMALRNESVKAVEQVISERLGKASEKRAELSAFREVLSEVAGALSEKKAGEGKLFPLVFIVDELDRCRPPFALSVIERIKHLFSVDRVCFILVTHLPQLETAIEGAYGSKFDAHVYLEKFYHLVVTLPKPCHNSASQYSSYVDYLWKALGISFADASYNQLIREQIQTLAEAHDLSLRRLERILTHVALVNAAAGPNNLIIPPLVSGLCVMRQTDRNLYYKAKRGHLNWEEAHKFLKLAEGELEQENWAIEWWKYATGEDMTPEKNGEYQRMLYQYNLGSRQNIIPLMAEYIDDLVQKEESA